MFDRFSDATDAERLALAQRLGSGNQKPRKHNAVSIAHRLPMPRVKGIIVERIFAGLCISRRIKRLRLRHVEPRQACFDKGDQRRVAVDHRQARRRHHMIAVADPRMAQHKHLIVSKYAAAFVRHMINQLRLGRLPPDFGFILEQRCERRLFGRHRAGDGRGDADLDRFRRRLACHWSPALQTAPTRSSREGQSHQCPTSDRQPGSSC